MHIILALLGVVVTILILLKRLQDNGLDVGWLNPITWRRRRKYRQQHDLNPAFKLSSPMEVVALLMVAVAKVDGDISKEQKTGILEWFQSEFHLNEQQSVELFRASVHLISQDDDVFNAPANVFTHCHQLFDHEKSASLCHLINKVSLIDGPASSAQATLLSKIEQARPQST